MAGQRKFVPTARTIRIGTMDEDNQGKVVGREGGYLSRSRPFRSVVAPASDQSRHTRLSCCQTGWISVYLYIYLFLIANRSKRGIHQRHHYDHHPRRVHRSPHLSTIAYSTATLKLPFAWMRSHCGILTYIHGGDSPLGTSTICLHAGVRLLLQPVSCLDQQVPSAREVTSRAEINKNKIG